jgi:hypothetical protein
MLYARIAHAHGIARTGKHPAIKIVAAMARPTVASA